MLSSYTWMTFTVTRGWSSILIVMFQSNRLPYGFDFTQYFLFLLFLLKITMRDFYNRNSYPAQPELTRRSVHWQSRLEYFAFDLPSMMLTVAIHSTRILEHLGRLWNFKIIVRFLSKTIFTWSVNVEPLSLLIHFACYIAGRVSRNEYIFQFSVWSHS